MSPRPPASELPPDDAEATNVHAPKTVAAGLGAIRVSMARSYHQMGVVRSVRTLLRVNQAGGFDCPGCAWPDPAHGSKFEFCENGAKAVATEATTRRVTPAFFAEHSIEKLAEQSDLWLDQQGRITHPMVLRAGATHYEPITWDAAFALIAEELNALGSPDEASFYTSGRTSNEAAFVYQLFVRMYGTNNLPDCSNMCHESSGTGMMESIGVGKATVTLEDFAHADVLLIVGQNPGTNHPRMLTTLQECRRRGARIISINPLREAGNLRFRHPQEPLGMLGPGTELTEQYLQVRINGDVAALQGIAKALFAEEARRPDTIIDRTFVTEHTRGYEAYRSAIEATSWQEIERSSGLTQKEIEDAAAIIWSGERMIICWAMGITQHKNGVANVQEILNLLLLRGSIGKAGAGACPVRGHSNVQGDRTMGIWEKMDDPWLAALGKEFRFTPPAKHGLDVVDTIHAMRAGRVNVFVGMGGNFLSATPDTEVTAKAMRGMALSVQVSTKLNRGHLVTGKKALILPCLGRTERDVQVSGEQFVTVEDSMSMVHSSHGTLPPASDQLRSEVAIVCGMAMATLGSRSTVDWSALAGNYDRIRDHISRVVPLFEDFNRRVRTERGFHLRNPAGHREWHTTSGKAEITIHPIPHHDLPAGRYLLMTMRSHDQYNTTVYGLSDRYRGIEGGRRVILMNPADIAEAGLDAGGYVDICSHEGDRTIEAPHWKVVSYAIPRGCAAAYYPEANVLVPLERVAARSNTPSSKSIVISVKKSVVAMARA